MTSTLDISRIDHITLDDQYAFFFSILSNNYNQQFKFDNLIWNCINHYIYGKLLYSIPLFRDSNHKDFTLNEPYIKSYENAKYFSLYTTDINTYIQTFIESSNTSKYLKNNQIYKSDYDNIILQILSSEDYNLGNVYDSIIHLETTKTKNKSDIKRNNENLNQNTKLLISIYNVIEGLKQLMYNKTKFNTLEEFENKTFKEIYTIIINTFGNVFLSPTINDNNIYELFKQSRLEYQSIYDKIIENSNLKNHIVKLFILSNYQKFNTLIKNKSKNDTYKSIIKTKLNEFLKLGEEPEDFDIDPVPYNIDETDKNKLYNLSIDKLVSFQNKFVNNYSHTQTISNDKIESLFSKIKEINQENETGNESDESHEINQIEDKEDKEGKEDRTKTHQKTVPKYNKQEDQLLLVDDIIKIKEIRTSTDDGKILRDHHDLSPTVTKRVKIGGYIFTSMIQYIYFNEFKNLYCVLTENNSDDMAYALLFDDLENEKDIQDYDTIYDLLYKKIKIELFNQIISVKKENVNFLNALYYSKSFKIVDEQSDNIYGSQLEDLIQTELIYNFTPPDNFIRILNNITQNNTYVNQWLEEQYSHILNMIICISIYYKHIITVAEVTYLIEYWYLKSFDIENLNTYIPPYYDSFTNYCNDKVDKLLDEYYNLFGIKCKNTLTDDYYKIIWDTIFKIMTYVHMQKTSKLVNKLQHILTQHQNIDINNYYINKAKNNIILVIKDNINEVSDSIVLSLILGKPIKNSDITYYLKTNPMYKSLPNSSEQYSTVKNNLFTFF